MSELDAPDWPCKKHGHTWINGFCECITCGKLFCLEVPGYLTIHTLGCDVENCEKLFWSKLFRGEGD